jgi:hypothetical protein
MKESVVVQQSKPSIESLLKRAFMFIEDGDWGSANQYCEKVLDIDPECARAYLGNLMVELKVKKQENLKDQPTPFDNLNNYQKAVRFADAVLRRELEDYIAAVNKRIEDERLAWEKRAECEQIEYDEGLSTKSDKRIAFITVCITTIVVLLIMFLNDIIIG